MKVALTLAELPDWKKTWIKASNAPPLGLAYLASHARKYSRVPGLEIGIFREPEDLIAFRPDLVGISAFTSGFKAIAPLAERVKEELGVPVILGGAHISALPESLPLSCDVGVLGEGEETFLEILEATSAQLLDPGTLSGIAGIAFRNGTTIVRTEPRPFITDLDRIPYPDRSLFGNQWPLPEKFEQLITSRGCPFQCSFCSIQCTMGRKPRFHSPEYVAGEIEQIRKRIDPDRIKVEDDLFTVRKDRARTIGQILKQRGLGEGLRFNGNARANIIDAEWCEILREIGFDIVQMGLESMSSHLLEFFHKKGTTPEINQKAVDTIAESGLYSAVGFIIGAPGETREDLLRVFNFILDNYDKFYAVAVNRLRIYPGTQVWDLAMERGLVDPVTLDGVAPGPGEDSYLSNRDFILGRYVYLNEESIPREEFAFYADLFDKFFEVMPRNFVRNRRLREVEEEKNHLLGELQKPLWRVIVERVGRRLGLK